jgi:hypothetical protein
MSNINQIQGELARLATDLGIDLSNNNFRFYRDTIIAMADNMRNCYLPGVMENFVFMHELEKGLIREFHPEGAVGRVDNIDKLVKEMVVQIASESCKCNLGLKTEEVIWTKQ